MAEPNVRCKRHKQSSRTCERGTRGCVVQHSEACDECETPAAVRFWEGGEATGNLMAKLCVEHDAKFRKRNKIERARFLESLAADRAAR